MYDEWHDFAVKFSRVGNCKISELVEVVNGLPKKKLSEITLYELLLDKDRKNQIRHGLYIFFDKDNKIKYIGKNSSSHYVKRISAHFALGPSFIDNGFIKSVVAENSQITKDATWEEKISALANAAVISSDYKLSFIVSGYGTINELKKAEIENFEKLLIWKFKPKFNVRDMKSGSTAKYEDSSLVSAIKSMS